jgi:hypothetical protein
MFKRLVVVVVFLALCGCAADSDLIGKWGFIDDESNVNYAYEFTRTKLIDYNRKKEYPYKAGEGKGSYREDLLLGGTGNYQRVERKFAYKFTNDTLIIRFGAEEILDSTGEKYIRVD